jgi:hypothetical protein
MPLQFTENTTPAGRLNFNANTRARMAGVVSVDWDHVTDKVLPYVAYTEDQGLTDEQKEFARDNIGFSTALEGYIIGTRTDAAAATIPDDVEAIRTTGYADPEDGGGALYADRRDDDPGIPGSFQSADGSYWSLVKRQNIAPEMFAAAGNGITVDDDAWEDLCDWINAVGGDVYIRAPNDYILLEPHFTNQPNIVFDFENTGRLNGSLVPFDEGEAAFAMLNVGNPGSLAGAFGTRATMASYVSEFQITVGTGEGALFAAGDDIAITSTGEYWNGITGASGFGVTNKGELSTVRSVSGDVITLETPLRLVYNPGVTDDVDLTYVRKVNTVSNITVKNFRALGNGNGINWTDSAVPRGPMMVKADCVRNLTFENGITENFARYAIETNIGYGHKFIDCRFYGRKLDDATNQEATPSVRFTGVLSQGIKGVDVFNCTAYYCRRLFDNDASATGDFDEENNQSVISMDCSIVGGASYNCITGPSGHATLDLLVNGHRIEGRGTAGSGFVLRGKNAWIMNCEVTGSVGIGIGTSTRQDPTAYSETPDIGEIYLSGNNFVCSEVAIQSSQSFTKLRIESGYYEAPEVLRMYGKARDNLYIGPAAHLHSTDITEYVVDTGDSNATTNTDWDIRGKISGGVGGVRTKCAQTLTDRIYIRGAHFEDLDSTTVLTIGDFTSPNPAAEDIGEDFEVSNCTGPDTSVFDINELVPWVKIFGNSWDDVPATVTAAATVDLSREQRRVLTMSGTTAIDSFGDGIPGDSRLLISAGGTINHSASILCPGGINLPTAANDLITARRVSTGVWQVARHRAIFPDQEGQAITGGFAVTSKSLGTLASGNYDINVAGRPLQHATVDAATNFRPGSNKGFTTMEVTLSGGSAAPSDSTFTKSGGDPWTNTSGHVFKLTVYIGNGYSTLVREQVV